LFGDVNPSSTFSANFHWLVEKKAFVWLIAQSSDACGGIGPLPGNPDSCQRHSPPSACRSEVEVLLVRKVESCLDWEPGWLLGIRRSNPQKQGEEHSWKFFRNHFCITPRNEPSEAPDKSLWATVKDSSFSSEWTTNSFTARRRLEDPR
jgi:hypothetical protein